jgi:hypothetical protein
MEVSVCGIEAGHFGLFQFHRIASKLIETISLYAKQIQEPHLDIDANKMVEDLEQQEQSDDDSDSDDDVYRKPLSSGSKQKKSKKAAPVPKPPFLSKSSQPSQLNLTPSVAESKGEGRNSTRPSSARSSRTSILV